MIDERDLTLVRSLESTFLRLDGKRLLVTGGTGFVGIWMLRLLASACDLYGLDVRVDVLSREPSRFRDRMPYLAAHRAIFLIAGDVRDRFPASTECTDLVIHAASETNVDLCNPPPETYFDVALRGTQQVIDFARRSGTQSILYTSSGAVYGKTSGNNEFFSEDDDVFGPSPLGTKAAYGNSKRACESLLAAAGASGGPACRIARLFAFVGPFLPLDSGYAIGNFIADGLVGRTIEVASDGTAIRSYLSAAEMAAWLWVIALDGSNGRAYNVGSEEAISIADLARAVGRAMGGVPVRIAGKPANDVRPNRYVPSTERIRSELRVQQAIPLEEALTRTIAWHRRKTKAS